MKHGGPYRILFALNGEVHGHAVNVTITDPLPNKRKEEGSNMAFQFARAPVRVNPPVPLSQLHDGNHRDLIRLTDNIWNKYDRIIQNRTLTRLD